MNLHIYLKITLLKWKELSKEIIITNIRAFFLNNKYDHVPCGFNASMDNCPAWTSSPQMEVKHEIKHVWSEDTPKNGSFRQASPKRLPQSEDLEAGRVRITDSKDPQFDPAVSQMAKYISVVQTECPCTQWHWCSKKLLLFRQFQENQIQWYNIDSSRMEIARHQGELSIRVFHPPELVSHFCGRYLPKLASKG